MKKIFYIVFFSISIFGCSDFLEVPNNEIVSVQNQFKDYSSIKIALAGVYFKTEELTSTHANFVYADVMGGNSTFTPITVGSNLGIINVPRDIATFYNFNYRQDDSEFTQIYNKFYQTINNTNNVIFFSDGLPDASLQQKKQLKAEALVARAFMHYNLLQLYGQTYNFSATANHKGIVYADRILVGGVDYPARNTVAECYILIVQDLQTALSLFSNEQTLSGPTYSYFNIKTTKAFLARIALQKRDWNLAIATANDVIATSGVSLMTASNYVSEWQKTNMPPSETLIEFSAPNDPSIQNLVSNTVAKFYKIPISATEIPGSYTCSSDLYALFENGDIRKNNFTTINLQVKNVTNQLASKPFFFTKKFQDNAGTMVMRLSEMYLILAEAHARQNNTTAALLNLNIIRQRANLSAISSTSNLLEEIFLERRRELCFEGHLFFDLARFNKNVVRSDCFGLQCNLTFPNPKMVLPIPRASILINQNIIQNESY